MPNLQTLELRENKLTSTKGIRLPSVKSIFIAANLITKLEDLAELKSLSALHLRDNKLEVLDGFSESMLSLQYINMRGNLIADYAEVKKLQILPKLKAIVLLDTPMAENGDYRLEVLISTRRLERLDKDEYSEEERTEAEEIYEQRRVKEAEEAAVAAEAAELAANAPPDSANQEKAEDEEKSEVEE